MNNIKYLIFMFLLVQTRLMAQMSDEEAANSDCMQTVSLSNTPKISPEQEECYRGYYLKTTKQTIKKVIVTKSRCNSRDSGFPIYLRKYPNYDAKIVHKIPIGTILNRTIGYTPISGVIDLGCFVKIIYNGEEFYAIDKKIDCYCGDKPAAGGKNLPQTNNPDKKPESNQQATIEYSVVSVEGGIFTMGAAKTEEDASSFECQYSATVGSFKIGKHEVTQSLWRKIMGNTPSIHKNCDSCPVENISHDEVLAFIEKLNKQSNKKYRLPTEQEWEYAARGGKKGKKFLYSGSNNYAEIAWYLNNAKETKPVGQKAPNELGIYDMSGNVAEWTSSIVKNYPCDMEFDDKTSHRVRGGSIVSGFGYDLRVSKRGSEFSTKRKSYIGFRLVESN